MIGAVTSLLSVVGWRGALAAGVGAMLAAVPAYHTGRLLERAATQAKIQAAVIEDRLRTRETQHDRIIEAHRARNRADADSGGADGVPDDGYRRD